MPKQATDTISNFIAAVDAIYQTGQGKEHSYRPALVNTLDNLYQGGKFKPIVNDGKAQNYGAPDLLLIDADDLIFGIIETKDVTIKLDDFEFDGKNKDQFKRYSEAHDNFILTNNLEFRYFCQGKRTSAVVIATIEKGQIQPQPAEYDKLLKMLIDFSQYKTFTLKSPEQLAKLMARKARYLADIFKNALDSGDKTTLSDQYEAFKKMLVHDLSHTQFADMYAQTLTYGLFSARLHDDTPNSFTRSEAQGHIPKTNPFLREMYTYIAGDEMLDAVATGVDDLANIFSKGRMAEDILKDFNKGNERSDPFIHFFETFLSEYDPSLRKARGVWYTPEPVVKFIVNAVDDILINDFHLSDGLADKSKIDIKVPVVGAGKKGKTEYIDKSTHKVQILDVATGTGTFLAEVIANIAKKMSWGWQDYVETDLIPRLHGFELLMASYTVCHTKLAMLLEQHGYIPSANPPRLSVYLTNSLEEHHPETDSLFASHLGNEANEANRIKRDAPIMVAIGNPPYSGESQNKGDWIMSLMEDYKKEPEGKEKLKERNPKWINDDYVKFIRMAQYYVEKNGTGIVAFINPHGYLDNPTFRGMRWNLLKTFDTIYTIDLHGNSKKKETAPDGGIDQNVFDIMQGVSINVFVKTGKKKAKELGKVLHYDLYGKREAKYEFLTNNSLHTIPFVEIPNKAPMYFMVQKDFGVEDEFQKGFILSELFPVNSVGVVTAKDGILISETRAGLIQNVAQHFSIEPNQNLITKIAYRPFDTRFIYYDTKLVERAREKVMRHMVVASNVGLVYKLGNAEENSSSVMVSTGITDFRSWSRSGMQGGDYISPLYLYPNDDGLSAQRIPNLNPEILKRITEGVGVTFSPEKTSDANTFAPIDLLDYIYGVLHSPRYRETYKEFLKIDFPRVPYPADAQAFWHYANIGTQLRELHLMTAKVLDTSTVTFHEKGSDTIEKIKAEPIDNATVKVWLNETQYATNVPKVAWEFYIGGYQPAQKWLKDRKGKKLSMNDIKHWKKIIMALTETHRLMQDIDTQGEKPKSEA